MLFLSAPWPDTTDPNAPNNGEGTEGAGGANPEGAQGAGGGTAENGGANPAENSTANTYVNTAYALALEDMERTPVGEELALWSYIHLIHLSATENGQQRLGETAGFLDQGFIERYSNPGNISEVQSALPAPTVFATEEYALYIYDLPTGERFIIYFDPAQSRCVGFNLQL